MSRTSWILTWVSNLRRGKLSVQRSPLRPIFYLYSTTVLKLAARYITGKEVGHFDGADRSISTLENYLDEKVLPSSSYHASHYRTSTISLASIKMTFNPDGKALALGPSTFWGRVSSEPTLVKIYAP